MRGAPGKVKRCLRKPGKSITIPDFIGPPGTLVCRYSGTVMKGAQMLSVGTDYVVAKPRKRKGAR